MQISKYQSFSTEEFLDDPTFIQFVKYGEADDLLFWNAFETAAINLPAYHLAKKELDLIYTANRITMPAGFETEVLSMINTTIDQQQHKKSITRRLYLAVGSVAAILGLVVFSVWLNNATVTISTAYGERKSFTLPDGSLVSLNANSSLKYPLLWRINHKRNVLLKGEAYFKVVHLNQDPKNIVEEDRFHVQTNSLKIEVLGTEFDVKDRNKTAKITLVNGKVSVLSLVSGRHYIMKPKQMALETKAEALKIVEIDPDLTKAWIDGNMKMQKTSVKEIMQEFADLYGKRIILSDPKMAEVRIDGMTSIKNEDDVLFLLSNILNAKIRKDSNTVMLIAK